MHEAIFEFELLTPAIIAGADQQNAEMRIPSIRGALRWWTRFMFGEEYEDDIFGFVQGTNCCQSKVFFRLLNADQRVLKSQNAESLTKNKYDYFLWPLQQKSAPGKPLHTRGVLDAGSRFKVSCKMKPGCEMWSGVLKCFLLFGSLGSRSRRAYGSIWPVSATFDGEPWEIPQTVESLLTEADEFFEDRDISIYRIGENGFDDYHEAVKCCADFLKKIRCGKDGRGYTASQWGKNDHDAGLQRKDKNYRVALGLPLVQRYSSSNRKVTYSIDKWERFASPLHFKIIKLKKGFVPLLLVIPEYAPESGTKIHAQVEKNNGFDLTLDTELLDLLKGSTVKDDKQVEKFGAIQIAYYASES